MLKKFIYFTLTVNMVLGLFSILNFSAESKENTEYIITPNMRYSSIRVTLNGVQLRFNQPPIIENGRTLVPLRAIFETMGVGVEWNNDSQTVTAVEDDTTIIMQIGNKVINKNGQNITLDVPPKIVGGRTLVPTRAVAEGFGAKVDWDENTRTVTIVTGVLEDKESKYEEGKAYRTTKSIGYNGIKVDVVIDKPQNNEVDVLIVYHGTVSFDNKILEAANKVLDEFKKILDRKDIMIVSVAYPEENLLIGDNLPYAEAALLWVKNKADKELGITINKIFLGGHSQGGYLVTRLNTLHQTNGVIANAPGPLNLIFRCQLEEDGKIEKSIAGNLLRKVYGSTTENPDAYSQRSLLNFTHAFKSDIIFVQGLNDGPIQMYSWPKFKKDVSANNTNGISYKFLDLQGFGHAALFQSFQAKVEFNNFINDRGTKQ